MWSDRVWKIVKQASPPLHSFSQVGALGEATGLGTDGTWVYYGNSTISSVNYGTIERANATDPEESYGQAGCPSPVNATYIYGTGVDKDYTLSPPIGPRVYAWEGRLARSGR